MSLSVCPAAKINAPLDKVWSLLYEPEMFGSWADANVVAVLPNGKAQAGQIINLSSKSVGVKWRLSLNVISVDANNHRIVFKTHLPFKLILKNIITCISNDKKSCIVRYG